MFQWLKNAVQKDFTPINAQTTQVPPAEISASLQENLIYLRGVFGPSFDLMVRELPVNGNRAAFVLCEGMCDDLLLSQIAVTPILHATNIPKEPDEQFLYLRDHVLSGTDHKEAFDMADVLNLMMSGFAALFIDGVTRCEVFGVQGFERRSISDPETEVQERGSRDGFVETLKVNTTLIRRRLKTPYARFEMLNMGDTSQTMVCLCYLSDRVNPDILEEVHQLELAADGGAVCVMTCAHKPDQAALDDVRRAVCRLRNLDRVVLQVKIDPELLGGFVLDALFGDPAWLPHPVVYMGKAISALEKRLRARLPKTPQGELLGGAIVAFCLPVGTFLLTSLVCLGAARISPWLGLAVQMFWCGQALAAKGLAQESTNVYRELVKPDLPAARRAVSRIVGRDTQDLTLEGVTRAAVETVAENASDGVIAPLLYMLIGGAPLALTYKAINTMDSMLGYKNEKYLYFGRVPAKLDDVANYIPSRLAALLWVAAAAFTHNDAKGAWKIWRRDRRNHASPNSAQTESACAGALGVQLAGPAYYFGEYYAKPTIGDPLRPIEPEDILRANRMMYVASAFALAWGVAIRAVL
mgnify:CR=1 FL=1